MTRHASAASPPATAPAPASSSIATKPRVHIPAFAASACKFRVQPRRPAEPSRHPAAPTAAPPPAVRSIAASGEMAIHDYQSPNLPAPKRCDETPKVRRAGRAANKDKSWPASPPSPPASSHGDDRAASSRSRTKAPSATRHDVPYTPPTARQSAPDRRADRAPPRQTHRAGSHENYAAADKARATNQPRQTNPPAGWSEARCYQCKATDQIPAVAQTVEFLSSAPSESHRPEILA